MNQNKLRHAEKHRVSRDGMYNALEWCNLLELQGLPLEGRPLFSEVDIAEGVGEREQSQRR